LGTVGHTGTFAPDASNALLRINLYFGAQKSCLSKLARRLKNPRAFTHGSVNLPDDSEPEPDRAIVQNRP
jgi:hypothetical protein